MRVTVLAIGLAAMLLLPFTADLRAQVTTATLYGTVQDSTGAVIPGGHAEVVNDDIGLMYTAPVNAEGDFVFCGLVRRQPLLD